MIPIFSFIAATVLYGIYAWLCFNPILKTATWSKGAGLVMAILANVVWIFLAHSTASASQLLFYAMVWDALVVLVSIVVPVLCFGSALTPIGWGGLVLVVAGIFMMKAGLK